MKKKAGIFAVVLLMIGLTVSGCGAAKHVSSGSSPDAASKALSSAQTAGAEQRAYALFSDKNSRNENAGKLLPLLPEIDWAEYEKVSGGRAVDLLQWVSSLKTDSPEDISLILNSTKNLDGAYAEQYSDLVGNLFISHQANFIKALAQLPEEKRSEVDGYVSNYCSSLADENQVVSDTKLLLSQTSPAGNERSAISELLNAMKK